MEESKFKYWWDYLCIKKYVCRYPYGWRGDSSSLLWCVEKWFWDNAFEPLFDQLIKAEAIRNETETKEIIDLGKSAVKIIALTLKGVFNKQIENVFDTDVLNKMGKEFQTYINLAQNATAITEEFFPEYTIFCEAIQRLKEYLEYVVKILEKLSLWLMNLIGANQHLLCKR